MPLAAYTMKLLGLAETLHRWLAVLTGLERSNRERIADFAEAIAATLARATVAAEQLTGATPHAGARAAALREFGRITGYIETIVAVLEPHLDGRKIAGLKRRLERLEVERLAEGLAAPAHRPVAAVRIERLLAAEGYFRALADGLRA